MVMAAGGARSASRHLGWGQQTKCPRVEFQVGGMAVEMQGKLKDSKPAAPN